MFNLIIALKLQKISFFHPNAFKTSTASLLASLGAKCE